MTQALVWSYSTLSAFIKCPAQYDAVKVKKLYPYVESPEAAEGNRQHKAFELYVKDKQPLPQNMQHLTPMMQSLCAIPGTKHVEMPLGVTVDGRPTGFFAKDVWVRGKADMVIDNSDTRAIVLDYKGGKSAYADTTQLKLTALMLFVARPALQVVDAALLFTKENKPIPIQYQRENAKQYWGEFMPDYQNMVRAHQANAFPPKPSGLCKRCPHKVCPYNRSED